MLLLLHTFTYLFLYWKYPGYIRYHSDVHTGDKRVKSTCVDMIALYFLVPVITLGMTVMYTLFWLRVLNYKD